MRISHLKWAIPLLMLGALSAACIELEPGSSTNLVGGSHTVTATLDLNGQDVEGYVMEFSINSGPNGGEVSDPNTGECAPNNDCTTDASGMVSWTYTSNGSTGVDTIDACITVDVNHLCATGATKTWVTQFGAPVPVGGFAELPRADDGISFTEASGHTTRSDYIIGGAMLSFAAAVIAGAWFAWRRVSWLRP